MKCWSAACQVVPPSNSLCALSAFGFLPVVLIPFEIVVNCNPPCRLRVHLLSQICSNGFSVSHSSRPLAPRKIEMSGNKSSIHSSPHLKVEPSPAKSSIICKVLRIVFNVLCDANTDSDNTANYTLDFQLGPLHVPQRSVPIPSPWWQMYPLWKSQLIIMWNVCNGIT